MKLLLVFLGLLVFVLANEEQGFCANDVKAACSRQGGPEILNCNAKYGQIDSVKFDLQSFANKHITHSFQYLLMSSHFGNYEKNRMGFSKLFRSLSDTAWNDAISIIKYLTKRGSVMDFKSVNPDDKLVQTKNDTYELYELHSLAAAVDIQKSLAEEAHKIHKLSQPDAEIMAHMQNTFAFKLRDTIRELSGHTNDLKNLVTNNKQISLHVYLFDEHLQKLY